MSKYDTNPLSEYQVKKEITDAEKLREYWSTGIGLNQVDGLNPSEYLVDLAKKHIDGEITSADVQDELQHYYSQQKPSEKNSSEYECDFVSKRIVDILSGWGFTNSPQMLRDIHGYLFAGMPEYMPGQYRNVELTKAEGVLYGDTVRYGACLSIQNNLEYDFSREKGYHYKFPMTKEDILHLSDFVSNIWQAHPFREGNTRTTAVFVEMYLRNMGYDINNDLFEKEAVYFRDALVRSNYTNVRAGIYETKEFLNLFFENLINHAGQELDHSKLFCEDLRTDEVSQGRG